MVGCGSMGGGMALLFAEDGINVSLSDPSEETMDKLIQKGEKAGYHGRLKKFKGLSKSTFRPVAVSKTNRLFASQLDYNSLCASLSKPRLLVFSLPHGN